MFWVAQVSYLVVCLFLTLWVLIQKGRGGGLASAFGGAGGNTAFGSKTGDVLTWATSVVFGIFLLLAIVLNWTANAREAAAQVSQNQNQSGPLGTTRLPVTGQPRPSAQTPP